MRVRGQGTCVADLSRIFGYLSPHYTQQLLMSADVTIIRPSSDTASSGHDSYNVPPTHDGEVDGVGEGGAGVDLEQYSTQYSTVQYSTVQYSTVQYSAVQYSTVQYSTVQYSTGTVTRLVTRYPHLRRNLRSWSGPTLEPGPQ